MKVTVGGNVPSFEARVPSVWDTLRDVRRMVAGALGDASPEVRDAAVMAASELAENVLKYGAEAEESPVLSVEMRDGRLVVRTENDVASAERIDDVLAIVERIGAHADPVALYAEAIDARLSLHPSGATRQGFIRIAAIGEFRITARGQGSRLFITAEREIP